MTDDRHISSNPPPSEADVQRLGALLRHHAPAPDFAAGFADRTMAQIAKVRLDVAPEVMRFGAMQRSFRMLSAAAAVAIVALGVHNTVFARANNASLLEAAIGLQPVSAEAILLSTTEALQ